MKYIGKLICLLNLTFLLIPLSGYSQELSEIGISSDSGQTELFCLTAVQLLYLPAGRFIVL